MPGSSFNLSSRSSVLSWAVLDEYWSPVQPQPWQWVATDPVNPNPNLLTFPILASDLPFHHELNWWIWTFSWTLPPSRALPCLPCLPCPTGYAVMVNSQLCREQLPPVAPWCSEIGVETFPWCTGSFFVSCVLPSSILVKAFPSSVWYI